MAIKSDLEKSALRLDSALMLLREIAVIASNGFIQGASEWERHFAT